MPLSTPIPQTFRGPRDDVVSTPPTSSSPLAPWSHLLEPMSIALTRLVSLTIQAPRWDEWWLGIRAKQVDSEIRLEVYIIWYNPSQHLKHERVAAKYKAIKITRQTCIHILISSLLISLSSTNIEPNTHLSDVSTAMHIFLPDL